MDSTVTAREAAFLSLKKIASEHRYSNLETDAAIKKHGLAGSEKTLYTRLVYGTVERLITIDYIIGKFSKIPPARIEPSVLAALRLGIYQIIWLDRVPDSAACNESVELVKKHSHRGAEGFVNGILRNVARNKNNLPLPKQGENGYLEIKYSLPADVVSLLVSQYGEEQATGFFEAFNTVPRVTVRVNTIVSSVGELEKELDCERTSCPNGLILNGTPDMSDGRFFVQ
ncbi:MAG: 16S rRNA (cytosine(967)-C(5))-methyltransferase RsmB, partial [Clostridia bacterium]|nr:16S rRNA (cytosine(967)-C(5))-methyltransferase RsmB [Clostridia bacterium]